MWVESPIAKPELKTVEHRSQIAGKTGIEYHALRYGATDRNASTGARGTEASKKAWMGVALRRNPNGRMQPTCQVTQLIPHHGWCCSSAGSLRRVRSSALRSQPR